MRSSISDELIFLCRKPVSAISASTSQPGDGLEALYMYIPGISCFMPPAMPELRHQTVNSCEAIKPLRLLLYLAIFFRYFLCNPLLGNNHLIWISFNRPCQWPRAMPTDYGHCAFVYAQWGGHACTQGQLMTSLSSVLYWIPLLLPMTLDDLWGPLRLLEWRNISYSVSTMQFCGLLYVDTAVRTVYLCSRACV